MALKIMSFDGADFFDKNGVQQSIEFRNDKKELYLPSYRFKIRFDDSLLLDRFDQVLKDRNIKKECIFKMRGDPATDQIIHVTFKYAVNQKVEVEKDGKIILQRTDNTIHNKRVVRELLYENGFDINGIHYVRWIHSPSNARTGVVYFINQDLLHSMNQFTDFGIDLTKSVNIADVEATRGLVLSSKIGTVKIEPKNILVINDITSTFTEKVMFTTADEDGRLHTEETETTINNTIFDGQSLMDKSLFPEEFKDKGMLLLRHKAFKSCCFNANIQQWFKDKGITDIAQLNGLYTPDATLEDIKLITTESSIKYKKFGDKKNWFYNWCKIFTKHKTSSEFGIVKYEKPTKYFDGRLVRTHYQLMNTLFFEGDELNQLLEDTFDYMRKILNDPILMYYHCRDSEENFCQTNEKFIAQMLTCNWDYSQTEHYGLKAKRVVEKIRSDIKQGKILIKGTYSTLLSCPVEMLKESIGQFDGTSTLEPETIVSTKFGVKKLLVCRSPHICAGNIYLPTNVKNEEVQRYVNLTDNIVVINTIGENVMQRLGGADFDSDQVMIVDNNIIIDAANKRYDIFKVPSTNISPVKNIDKYTPKNLAEVDNKIANNKIGEIVNFSQILNSYYWDIYSNALKQNNIDKYSNQLTEIYSDICQLAIMSMLEIDKAKRDFGKINNNAELIRLRNKYNNLLRPMFLKEVDKHKPDWNNNGNTKRENIPKYKKYNCTVDHMYQLVSGERFTPDNILTGKIDMIINKDVRSRGKIDNQLIEDLEDICRIRKSEEQKVRDNYREKEDRYKLNKDIRDDFLKAVDSDKRFKTANVPTVRKIVKDLDSETKNNETILEYELDALLSVGNKALLNLIKDRNSKVPSYAYDTQGEYNIYNIGVRVTR